MNVQDNSSVESGTLITSWAIDSDVHPNVADGLRSLKPYLSSAWVRRLGLDTMSDWGSRVNGNQITIPTQPYINPHGTMRPETMPPGGGVPGSVPEMMNRDFLDVNDLGGAVITPGPALQLGGFPDADMATAIAGAINEWQAQEWFTSDPRWLGSIVVSPRDPLGAAKEVHKWGKDPRMVQVFIPSISGISMGKRHFYPIYEAANEYGLVIANHPGSEGAGANDNMFAVGAPSYYFEYHALFGQSAQSNLVSLVAEGVFDRFPNINVLFQEQGFAWLVEILWRMDQKWKGVRSEIPWVTKPPSEYVMERVRLASQPMYEPRRGSHLEKLFEIINAEQLLVFSSDYPHWDTDDPMTAYTKLPERLRTKMFIDNPYAFFKLRRNGSTPREGVSRLV
ncbi:amidohydrolase 2 (plasmid) [Rhizobium leguminosarum bv. trifolii WSM2304]|uniref:Amidohydrolase 2 n=1 Tax=Rhizobium leguminosarum bv. trifolii (strain WSM2304) TaxID=395492 RepID=A0ABF7QZD6_RHILW|nr:amidohydrolase family protein [Rhizobium leguminosarum]ACI59704.1 amidohydrolase 2 [Rhizobium leguminosarum bv. trifolii WSM2304]